MSNPTESNDTLVNGDQHDPKPDIQLSTTTMPMMVKQDHDGVANDHENSNNDNLPAEEEEEAETTQRQQRPDSVARFTALLPPTRSISRYHYFIPILILIITIIFIATMDRLRTFVIEERALLTQKGRVRHRTRRRVFRKTRHCDESDEPKAFQIFTGWRRLSVCVEYDLSLRKRPLGDNGVRRLVGLLGRNEYAAHHNKRKGQLKVLNLERQGISTRGAGYLARWLSADPIPGGKPSSSSDDAHHGDDDAVERIPTAASSKLFINLEGNPIGPHGVKQLERAVHKARFNGISVVIIGGGSYSSEDGVDAAVNSGGTTAAHVISLGPISYTRKATVMPPWRLPVPFRQRVKQYSILLSLIEATVFLCVGFVMGRTCSSFWSNLPYRFDLIRNNNNNNNNNIDNERRRR